MNSWRKFRLLSWWERRLFIQALLLLPLTGLALRIVGFNRWQSVLTRLSRVSKASEEVLSEAQAQKARATTRMVRAAAWHGPYHARCLPQSLTLCWLLRRQGIESDLRFGARKDAGRLEVHAWVELMGLPPNETDSVHHRFVVFDRSIMPVQAGSQ